MRVALQSPTNRHDEKSGKEKKGVLLTIDLSWGDIDVDAPPKKAGKYTAKSNITRREFVEKALGVKFGEEIPVGVKNGSIYNDDRLVVTKLTQPVCGINTVEFYCERDRKLSSIGFDKNIAARSLKGAEPEYGRLCREVRTWLGIDSFQTKDTNEDFMTKEGKTLPTLGRVSSFEDGSIRVDVKMCVWSAEFNAMPGGSKGTSLGIKISLPAAENMRKTSRNL